MASYSDNFNRANEPLNTGGAWAEVSSFAIVSNQVGHDAGSALGSARYESDLDTDDHSAQVAVTLHAANEYAGAAARHSTIDATFYAGWSRNHATHGAEIWRCNAGTFTLIARDGAASVSVPFTMKIEVNGSNLELFRDGVSKVSTTDTNITGNLRAGLVTNGTTATTMVDDWAASDLAAATSKPKHLALIGVG